MWCFGGVVQNANVFYGGVMPMFRYGVWLRHCFEYFEVFFIEFDFLQFEWVFLLVVCV